MVSRAEVSRSMDHNAATDMVDSWSSLGNDFTEGSCAMARGHKAKANGETSSSDRLPRSSTSLSEEMCELLADIVRDRGAPASARASAGRTVLEELRSRGAAPGSRPLSEMSMSEIDDEIARAQSPRDRDPVAQ